MTPEKHAELIDWTERNLRRGCTPISILDQLKTDGYSADDMRQVTTDIFYSAATPVDHARLANLPFVATTKDVPGLRQLPTKKAQIYTWEGFLSDEECNHLIELIESQKRPSTITEAFADKYIRTSETSDLGTLGDPFIYEIDEKIAGALGLHWSYSDSNQGQKYSIGQEFKAHHDYFTPNTQEYLTYCQHAGQRTWTFMIYLNDTPAGGGTRFRKLEKTFYPKKGMAVLWNNLKPDGTPNPYTLHHGMKVREGEKYVITKWFRERGWGPMFLEDRPPIEQSP